jgi:hypothetical protein
LLSPFDGRRPRPAIRWIAGEEIVQAGEIKRVVGCETPDPREAPDVDSKFVLCGRDGWLGEHRGYCRKPLSAVSRQGAHSQ